MPGPREWSPRGKLKKYTVVAYWEEEGDPWLEFGEGYTPEEGLKNALKLAMEAHDWDLEFMKGLTIVEVVGGHHPGLLGNPVIFSGYEALTGKWEP